MAQIIKVLKSFSYPNIKNQILKLIRLYTYFTSRGHTNYTISHHHKYNKHLLLNLTIQICFQQMVLNLHFYKLQHQGLISSKFDFQFLNLEVKHRSNISNPFKHSSNIVQTFNVLNALNCIQKINFQTVNQTDGDNYL